MSDKINFLELFDKYQTKEVEVCQMADDQHFLFDLYVNELWEVRKCYPERYYDKKRKQWFEFEPVEFICNTKQFGSPNGYFTIELKPIIEAILQKDYKKQGALEEQKKELVFLNKLQERLNGYHCGYHEQLNKMINNRKEDLKKKGV
jgi:hypothetical protein